MFALLNKKRKILSYFCHIININAYLFQEHSVGISIRNNPVSMETESASTDSQINPTTTVIQVKQPTSTNENKTFQFFPLDKSLPIKKRKNYLTNEHNSFSLPLNTQEPPLFIINKEHRSVENNSGEESSEEIGVLTIDLSYENKHSNLVDLDAENNQIIKPHPQDPKLQEYFQNSKFKPYKPDKVDVSCNKLQNIHIHQNNYSTTRFDTVLSTSRVNLIDSISFDSFKTNSTQLSIYENEVIPHSLQNQWKLPINSITQQYLSNSGPIRRTICNNISPEDIIDLPVGRKNILDTTTLVINTNEDIRNFKRAYTEENYEQFGLRHFQSEPPRKILKQILTDAEDNSISIPSTSHTKGNNYKDIMDTRNKLENGHTFPSKHISTEYPIRWTITDTNTPQQTSSYTYSKSSLLKHAQSKNNLQISIKDYKSANNDEPSLKKILVDSYSFNFILDGTLISCNFNRQNKQTLFLDLSGVSIKEVDFNSTKSVNNMHKKFLRRKHYLYFIPIFHTVDFVSSNNIDYFRISVSSRKYSINLRLEIYIPQSKSKEDPELRLKCPRINNFKQLIDKLFETTFPIYFFPYEEKIKIIQFQNLSSLGEPIKEMTLNEYIKDITENPPNIDIKGRKEYTINPKRQTSEIKRSYNENRKVWNSGLKIVYDIFKTFYTNINQITIIIDDNSKLPNSKMTDINRLLNQIIQKIEINFRIKYPQESNDNHQRESELMSFYAFCTNELQYLFKWWNKYVFVNEEVQYITKEEIL